LQRLARIRQLAQAGNAYKAAGNNDRVRCDYENSSGTYIAFQDEPRPGTNAETQIGGYSPDPTKVVVTELNRPFWVDVGARKAAFFYQRQFSA